MSMQIHLSPDPSWEFEGRARTSKPRTFGSGDLSTHERAIGTALLPKFSGKAREEFLCLLQERDFEMFFEGLLALGGRLEGAGKVDLAGEVYSRILQGEATEPIQSRAQQRLDALIGRGHWGNRAEVLLGNFTDQATDYRIILPMIAGTMAGQWTRTALLGRLSGVTHASWVTRGTGALWASRMGGFFAEVPAFAGLGHFLHGGQGSFERQLTGAGITLGAMRLGGMATLPLARLGNRWGWGSAVGGALYQGGIIGGLLAAQRVEVDLGLRPDVDGATNVTDALASWLALGVGARLGHGLLSPDLSKPSRRLTQPQPSIAKLRVNPLVSDLRLSSELTIPPVTGKTPTGMRESLSRFFNSGPLAAIVPGTFSERFRPTDPALQGLMDPIALNDPHFPLLRLAIAGAAITVPLLLRPFSKKASSKARWIRDMAVPPLVGLSLVVGQGSSLDCYIPEILAGGVTFVSWVRRAIAKGRGK